VLQSDFVVIPNCVPPRDLALAAWKEVLLKT
jgi:hypothetical protein